MLMFSFDLDFSGHRLLTLLLIVLLAASIPDLIRFLLHSILLRYYLPQFRWYLRLRTRLFHYYPSTGTAVRWRTITGSTWTGTVINVNPSRASGLHPAVRRSSRQVLVDSVVSGVGARVWRRVGDLEWIPKHWLAGSDSSTDPSGVTQTGQVIDKPVDSTGD